MEIIILLLWIVGTMLAGYVASQKGRSVVVWALVALLFSPLLGLIAVAALPTCSARPESERVPETALMKKCPECAEEIRLEANVCRYCRHGFDRDAVEAEVMAARERLVRSGNEVAAGVVNALNGALKVHNDHVVISLNLSDRFTAKQVEPLVRHVKHTLAGWRTGYIYYLDDWSGWYAMYEVHAGATDHPIVRLVDHLGDMK
jgi:hypothetical protein